MSEKLLRSEHLTEIEAVLQFSKTETQLTNETIKERYKLLPCQKPPGATKPTTGLG